jgi:alanine racemase
MTAKEYKTWLEVDKKNIASNINQFQQLIGQKVNLMAVVKSNAYGHGLVEIARIAASKNVNWLGVDSIDEALALRKAGIRVPVLVLGYTLLINLKKALEHDISLVVYNIETLEEMSGIKAGKKFKVHIKLETGTSRQGVYEKELLKMIGIIKQNNNIELEGVSTHYANIEDTTDHSFAQGQLDEFMRVVKVLESQEIKINFKHTACSAATILYPETYFNMVRVGISLYGLWSSKETMVMAMNNGTNDKEMKKNQLEDFELKPALTWKTRVAQIKKIKSGTSISYGLTEKVTKDSMVAVVPVGYWDGYDRKLSSVGNVLIRGCRCKVLGRVCMNMMVVDVSNVRNIGLEDEVVLLGKQLDEEITADEIAGKIGTINYEVVTRINPIIPRVVK